MDIENQIDDLLALKKYNEAFPLILKTYQERIFYVVFRITNDENDAKDVTQNTFIKVFQKLDSFKHQSQVYTWIHRIATNESLNFVKSKKRKWALSLDQDSVGGLTTDIQLSGSKIQAILAGAIGILPAKQRQVFELRYFDEMRYSEIAERLDQSEGGLKASYHHAVKKIEAYIKKLEIFES